MKKFQVRMHMFAALNHAVSGKALQEVCTVNMAADTLFVDDMRFKQVRRTPYSDTLLTMFDITYKQVEADNYLDAIKKALPIAVDDNKFTITPKDDGDGIHVSFQHNSLVSLSGIQLID